MFEHTTVLLEETVQYLNTFPTGTYVDMTFGRGGHTRKILSQLDGGRVIAFDRDNTAIAEGEKLAQEVKEASNNELIMIKSNFENIKSELAKLEITEVNGIIYDLGVSSPQFDDPMRGFSYKNEARLDMRMDQNQELDAYKIVNEWTYENLVRILFRYGDEKFAKRIAREIERQREIKPIETTIQLADLVKNSIPAAARRTGGHPAKKSFQAIRIAVNDELGSLEKSLKDAIDLVNVDGRICVITFQSLEDRIVKQMFKEFSEVEIPRGLPVIPDNLKPTLKMISRKPILPTDDEQEDNHRAHSAKLRVVEKINN
ncbi:ribosomal RNA small subunit methyltransferase H [Companilactobacillus sp. RD055328]|uniref:16S rRNA (cytosine(1402)-N(4))-methyltransferase RsmH n=1 Tax=Companilactobacillus sp. RD055328 TaxID=2916634 RepID=UPI001FC8E12C|nr:16S rRNA (cytosine(1402)-N(4))-methyltransferase RsmH [Companilactobacillus sp. RD055328]GKQ42854.1 ribosomal RNA small subunit methyltransferase H [Companilactobacillus sp. RD055328]